MLRRAVELDPSNAQAMTALGAAMIRQGEVQGIDFMLRGMKISPRDNRRSAWGALLARGMLNFGQIDKAIRTASDACRCDDRIFLPRVVLAIAYVHEGNLPRAVDALSDARRIRPNLAQFRDEYSFVMFGHDPFYQGNAVNALGMKPKLIQLEHDELNNKDHWRATQYGHGQIEHP